MPIYEYECKKCGHRFEVIQKFSDEPISICETCGGKVSKLLAAPALMFKGTGWYVTDYSSKGKKPVAKEGDGKTKTEKDSPKTGPNKKSDKPSAETNKKSTETKEPKKK
ncbi:MAG TPA: FmdB family zinc ribbon protein [Nitrospiria bacterium]